jgi:hypothetical protein
MGCIPFCPRFKRRDGVGELGEVIPFGEPFLQAECDRGLPQRQMGLGDDKADAALAQAGHENGQLLRRGHVNFRNGTGTQDHLANGPGFVGQEMFQALDDASGQWSVASRQWPERCCPNLPLVTDHWPLTRAPFMKPSIEGGG